MKIKPLINTGDHRGFSSTVTRQQFGLPEHLQELHCNTLVPGQVRGNHFHKVRGEIILVFHSGSCCVAWDDADGTTIANENFDGNGAFLIEVEPLRSHAIKNTGTLPLTIVALSDFRWTPEHPDTYPRVILHPDA